jgi:mono/diheme cytochrome c family protein
MQTKKIFVLLSLLLMGILVAGCGTAQPGQQAATADEPLEEAEEEHLADEADDHGVEVDEHGEHAETPHEFEEMRNPFAGDAAAIAAGQAIFETSCATCHGPAGEGDGPAAKTLDPKPASLADVAMMQDLSDGYLYWRISEGGQMEPFNSAMPAWKEGLSEQEIWQTISFVRSLSDSYMDDAAEEEHHE